MSHADSLSAAEGATTTDPVSTSDVAIEITAPIGDACDLGGAQRLRMAIHIERALLGTLELPVCDGRVLERVIRDAIADRFGWRILGEYFKRTRYSRLEMRREAAGWSAYDASRRLAGELPDDADERLVALHELIGWSVLLDELAPPLGLVGTLGDLADRVVRRLAPSTPSSNANEPARWVVIEASEPPPSLLRATRGLLAELRVGGAPVAASRVSAGLVGGRRLRTDAIDAAGFELCCAVVREALLGRPLADGESIRERLRHAARSRLRSEAGESDSLSPAPDPDAAPGWITAARIARSSASSPMVVANRRPMNPGTSASRYAALPAGCGAAIASAERCSGGRLPIAPLGAESMPVVYAPDMLWNDHRTVGGATPPESFPRPRVSSDDARREARFEFESLFAREVDPFGYASEYEQIKYGQTLSLLGASRYQRALEIACAEGHFTYQLASRVDSLLAVDISELALERAAARSAAFDNVEFRQLDVCAQPLPEGFDLVVCSEMLYYVSDRDGLAHLARRMIDAVVPGGYLVTMHSHALVDSPSETGFDWDVPFGASYIAEVFSALPDVHLVRELRAPMYRALLFRRDDGSPAPVPERTETDRYGKIPPRSIPHLRWGGGEVQRDAPRREMTARLPILMYHRVAPDGVPGRERYRVTPEQLERQLRYLRDSGFRTITLEEWREAVRLRRPLDGRAVILTFDDGFADFAEHAWPLLSYHGFGALAFVVTDAVGRWNDWSAVEPQAEPLMGWETLCRLEKEGLEIGAHTATHPNLDTLDTTTAAIEIARSRAVLAERISVAPTAIAYPFGSSSDAVHHLAGACGFRYGLTTRAARATFADSLLALPRLEVRGDASFAEFVAMLAV